MSEQVVTDTQPTGLQIKEVPKRNKQNASA